MAETHQELCTFRIASGLFGVPVRDVREVIALRQITPVPLAPSGVGGLINLRGDVLTVIHLHDRLGEAIDRVEGTPHGVVVWHEGEAVCLGVDAIVGVDALSLDTLEPPPNNLREATREIVRGVHKLPDELLLVLNTQRALMLS